MSPTESMADNSNQNLVTEEPVKKNKKKKKRLNAEQKAQKRRNKEETALKELYRPKDTHIQAINPELFAKLKGATSSQSSSLKLKPQVRAKKKTAIPEVPVVVPAPPSKVSYTDALKKVKKTTIDASITGTSRELDNPFDFPTLSTSLTLEKFLKRERASPATEDSTNVASTSNSHTLTASLNKQYEDSTRVRDSVIGEESPFNRGVDSAWETDHEDDHKDTSSTQEQEPKPSKKKHSKKPIVINIDTLLKSSHQTKPKAFDGKYGIKDPDGKNLGAGTGTKHKVLVPLSRSRKLENVKITKGNVLDSSGPGFIKRGKIRQKKKRLTRLKRSILASRALKRKLNVEKLAAQETSTSSSDSGEKVVKPKDSSVHSGTVVVSVVPKITEYTSINLEGDVKTPTIEPRVNETTASLENLHLLECKEVEGNVDAAKEIKIFREIINATEKEAERTVTYFPKHVVDQVKKSMHARKFRPYCDMYTSKELHGHVIALTKELYRFQDRLYHNDPIKFKTKRRLVNGLKDVLSYLSLNLVQMVILAPDVESNDDKGGLDDKISQIIRLAQEKGVPYLFSGNKFILGKAMKVKSPVSAIAVLNKQNAESLFDKVVEETHALREKYKDEFRRRALEVMKLNVIDSAEK